MGKIPEFADGEIVFFIVTIGPETTSPKRTIRKAKVLSGESDLGDWSFTIRTVTDGLIFKLPAADLFTDLPTAKANASVIIKGEIMARQNELVDIYNLESEKI